METERRTEPVVLQYLTRFLPITMVWLYNQLNNLQGFRTPFLCRIRLNEDQFSQEEVHALESLPMFSRMLNLLVSKITGYIPWFHSRVPDADLLHVHFGYNGVKLTGLKKKLNIPMLVSFYGIDAFSFPFRKKQNLRKLSRMFREADRILVLGPYMKDALAALGCEPSKMTIHHLGVDVDAIRFRKREHRPGEALHLLMASSFLEKKGVDICLKALVRLKDTLDFQLEIIGDGPMKEELMQIISEGGIRDRVTLHGYKPYDFFIQRAYDADVFLQASKTSRSNDKEGTPMSLVDAMATGLPVVSTRHSDIPEIVWHGHTGFLAEENSIDSFEKAIATMAGRIGEISEFSMQSRLRVEENFNVRTQTERLATIYRELIK